MRRARRTGIVALAAIGLVACNIIAGFESDYVVGGSSGTASEAGTDGPSSDGPTDPDAKTDASTDAPVEAQAPFRCTGSDAAYRVFCDDFEETTGAPFKFEKFDATTDATVALTTRSADSRALKIEMVNTTGTSALAWLSRVAVAGNPRDAAHYELDFDVKVAEPTLDYAALAILTFSAGADREHGVAIERPSSLGRLQPQTGARVVTNAPESWHHCHVTLDREASGTTFRRQIEITNLDTGMKVGVDGDGGTTGLSSPTAGGVELRLGAFNSAPNAGAIKAEFDNVVVRSW